MMLKIIRDKWDKNKDQLQEVLGNKSCINNFEYLDLVKLCFDVVFNTGEEKYKLLTKEITEIDNGSYQGTLLYMIPFDTYQPSEAEYLMSFVDYGSCSGCDTLQGIMGYDSMDLPTVHQVSGLIDLCKDILVNTIKPYNYGWRHNPDFDTIEM